MAPNPFLQRVTWVMVALATIVAQAALWSSQTQPWLQMVALTIVIGLVVAGGYALRNTVGGKIVSAPAAGFLLLLWLLPFLAEPLVRTAFGVGNPMELLIVLGLRNLMLGMASLRTQPSCQRLACFASFFLVLFAFLLNFNWLTATLVGMYAITANWWLIGSYWERLSGKMPDTSRRQLPKRASLAAVVIVCVVALCAGAIFGASPVRRVLAGVFPSSGGDSRPDPYAASGVGDGDQLVSATDDAMSFGPVESEVFLDSQMPTLYDMFNDLYGEKPKKTERAISVEFQDRPQREERIAKSSAGSREFSTIRQRTNRRTKELEDRQAAAMFYIVGRTPTHLALETFDTFDGVQWTKSDTDRFISNLELETIHEQPWLRMRSPSRNMFAEGYEPFAVKIINIKTGRIPSPPHLARVHIDRVDRLEFYGWTDDGMLQMPNRDHVPQFTVLHLRALRPKKGGVCELGDFRRLAPKPITQIDEEAEQDVDLSQLSRNERMRYDLAPYYQALDQPHPANVLCSSWIADQPGGWPQVEAVVQKLRDEFKHDPQASAPEDCRDVVAHFLKERRGPDYMFATTAAAMLRGQGYPTRLVAGFYARPERYDSMAKQTAVLGEDVHVWAEVCIDGVHWMPIEPTPGYQPPPESLSLAQWVAVTLWVGLEWIIAHWLVIGILLVFASVMVAARRSLLDAGASTAWWLFGRGSATNCVRWTIWLLEQRAQLAGQTRPAGTTFSRWYSQAAQPLPTAARNSVRGFLQACDRVLYGRNHTDADVARLCAAAVQSCRRRLFQQVRER